MNRSIDHIAIAVWNIDEALPYYRDQLGFGLIEEENLPSAGVRLVYLDAGNTMIQLLEPIGETPIRAFLEEKGEGLHHLCLAVDHIPALLNRLPGEADRTVVMGGRGRRACFLNRKPSGVPIELTELEPYRTAGEARSESEKG